MNNKMYLATMIKSKKGTFWAVGIIDGDVNTTWIQVTEAEYDDICYHKGEVVDIACIEIRNGKPVYEIFLK